MEPDDQIATPNVPVETKFASASEPEFTDLHFGEGSLLLRHLEESRAEYAAGNYQSIEELAAELGVELEEPIPEST